MLAIKVLYCIWCLFFHFLHWLPTIIALIIPFPLYQESEFSSVKLVVGNRLDFVRAPLLCQLGRRSGIIRTMFLGFLVRRKETGVEDWMNKPSRGQFELVVSSSLDFDNPIELSTQR